jgi:hypothetical protein
MTAPSGGPFWHDLIEGMVIWEDSDSPGVAKVPVDVNLAINTPQEATDLPIQGVADVHMIDATHDLGEALSHDGLEAAHHDVVVNPPHVDTQAVSGESGHGSDLAVSHDDSTGSGSA